MTPLHRERIRRGLTKAKMAELCGVDRAAYGRYEDATHRPSLETASNIAKRLGNAVTRDQLLYPEEYTETLLQEQAS